MKRTLITQAPAKINIGLWVKGKRADGYHELASLMQTISLSDTIAIKETREEGLRIECDHPAVPTGPENLVYKAAMLLLQRLEIAPRLLIQIEKRIPVAAGLAGGSTDAAAVMVALARFYDASLPLVELMEMSQTIGSDVPFVMHGGLALATGRGENLTFYDPPKPSFVVVIAVPKNVQVSTKWAYENYQPGDNTRKEEIFATLLPAYRDRNIHILRSQVFNDLESVTLHRHPDVANIKETLAATGKGVVLMSGSGPSVFGLFDERRDAMAAISGLDPAGVDVFIEHTMRPQPR
ncbi:MAG TPA: 4-(cytidine 5'-diphospho)-2-C-methyl-D-erythritol kinase [Candidatus Ozemobacteraceae bacterium]|nr:4-(cytidine 5'-diphospho)-2-C-methyl-D-erythritol kinase [Candidatus Ozemobacteraceae bacterium]